MPFTGIQWKDELPILTNLAKAGWSLEKIGDKYGVSKQRIKQLFQKFSIEKGVPQKRQERELKHYKKYGDKTQELYKEKWKRFKQRQVNSKRRGIIFDLQFSDITWTTHCPILNIELNYLGQQWDENFPEFDKIIPEKGYIKGNVVIISRRANRIKNDGSIEEHEKIIQYMKDHR